MTATGDLDPVRIGELHAMELARCRQARPRSLAIVRTPDDPRGAAAAEIQTAAADARVWASR